MSHHCHSGSCSGEHTHSHSHGGCSCDCHKGCQCPCHHEQGHSYADQLLHLADEAWMDVIKEKVKEEIIKHSGEHLTKLAQLISETNHKRWNEKLSEAKNEQDFEDRLHELMHGQCCKK